MADQEKQEVHPQRRKDDPGDYQRWLDPVEVVEWEPVPEKPGTVRVKRVKMISEVCDQLKHRLGFRNGYSKDFDEGLSSLMRVGQWPYPYRRTAVFPVTGGSEGHYVHVVVFRSPEQAHTQDPGLLIGKSVLGDNQLAVTVLLAKTFQGWDHAWKIARILGASLGV